MKVTRAHLWAGLLVGIALQMVASSCLFDGCPDEPTYVSFEDGSYVPQKAVCELYENAVITLEDDVVHIDYVAEDGYEYRVIYDVVEREWD